MAHLRGALFEETVEILLEATAFRELNDPSSNQHSSDSHGLRLRGKDGTAQEFNQLMMLALGQ